MAKLPAGALNVLAHEPPLRRGDVFFVKLVQKRRHALCVRRGKPALFDGIERDDVDVHTHPAQKRCQFVGAFSRIVEIADQ